MKRIKKFILAAGSLLAVILCLTACSGHWDAPYESLNQSGYNVSVRFDANGGVFAGTNDVYIIDVFNQESASADSGGCYLLSPDDPIREEGAFAVSRTGYFLAGWYTQRSPRVNDQGEPLDDYGVPTSVSGREQGYSYSGKWDFSTDTLTVDAAKTYSADTPVCTLYAAWIPYFTYEFHAVDVEAGTSEQVGSVQSIDLEVPSWNESTGKLDMKKFPGRDGYTLDAAYLSSDLSVAMTEKIHGSSAYVDYESGTTSTEVIPIYTTWLEGSWFKIFTAKQFYSNSRLDGNYIICGDIDFADEVWSPTLTKGKFTGKIIGNGFTFSNIAVIQADNSQLFGGLFGALDAGAVIEGLTFENVSYTIQAGSRMQGAAFGLLAGSLSSDAALNDIAVSGTIYISEKCYPLPSYVIGLLCGSGNPGDVDLSAITCQTAEENSDLISVETAPDGTVSVTFHQ